MKRTVYSLVGALVLTHAAFAQGQGGGKPPTEEAGNNLSIPAIFVPDATGGPVLRVPCGTYAVPGWDGVPSSTLYTGYWLQKTDATWSADCTTALSANVIADWGDNLTSRPNLPSGKPVRVEVILLDTAAIGMRGFVITNLTPDLEDRLSTYGTRGFPDDAFTTGDAGAPVTRVFDTGATLTIERLENGIPVAEIFDGPMTAEINSTGSVVYGFNWGTKGRKNTPAAGIYRLTFRTVATTITGITDTAAIVVPTWDAGSTSLTIELTSGKKPGKGGGGGGGGGPRS
jgi:hypothetical protein